MQCGALLTAKVVSLQKKGLSFRNLGLALWVKYHFFPLQCAGIGAASRTFAAEKVRSQHREQNPRDDDDYNQAQ